MPHSILASCQSFVFDELLTNWSRYGFDPEQGYSYESMTHSWTRNTTGRIRLLTQCRQLYTFSHAYQITGNSHWKSQLSPLFEFIISHYYPEKRWFFSLNDDLSLKDTQSDAYALAFILLSFSFYHQATKDDRALRYMEETNEFLLQYMQAESGGFFEAYPIDDTQIRRQNPHMHLLEGYIAAFNATQSETYKKQIQNLLELALTHFYDKKSQTLREFFTRDWEHHPKIGNQVEPGHHFEWVWLLYQANTILPNQDYLDLAQSLWLTATRYGMDPKGGIYNQIDGDTYQPLDQEKRIWPLTEYLKAITVIPIGKEEKEHRLNDALTFAKDYYFIKDGRWNEYLDANNQAKDFPLPGTSSYHIFLGLCEVITWAESHTDFE